MALKILIVVLFIGVVISLASSFVFLVKDIQSPKKRILHSLGTRVTLAALLLIAIFYGLYTGQLGSGAPWDAKPTKAQMESTQ